MDMKQVDQISISSAQVRAARGLLNWTQSELADRCSLTKATIANIENEKHHLTTKTANKIFFLGLALISFLFNSFCFSWVLLVFSFYQK